jgi:hypothetical protein
LQEAGKKTLELTDEEFATSGVVGFLLANNDTVTSSEKSCLFGFFVSRCVVRYRQKILELT